MELREALCQISEIRQQMARSGVFRGYRSLTVGFSGALALLAAVCQPYFVASPDSDLDAISSCGSALLQPVRSW